MRTRMMLAIVTVLWSMPLLCQQPPSQRIIVAEGGAMEERGSARVLYWDTKLNTYAGQFAIDYGRPEWKKDYEDPAKFDGMTKGKVWRMGKDFWTILDSSLPLKISGKSVPPGYYYLGLRRSTDGAQWSLALLDPVKIRAALLDAYIINKAKVEFEVPVKVEHAKDIVGKLTIALAYQEKTPTHVTFKLAWGNFVATAPIEVTLVK
ncbi:MAG: DUF2911 domain-containing protein [Acidobacteria bacterium]|nr:DUF2911 domain-containing protein [Acidobacteriota bacterium]